MLARPELPARVARPHVGSHRRAGHGGSHDGQWLGIMVGSFRETVSLWMDNQLKADFYLRPAGCGGGGSPPHHQPEIADRLERIPALGLSIASALTPFRSRVCPPRSGRRNIQDRRERRYAYAAR